MRRVAGSLLVCAIAAGAFGCGDGASGATEDCLSAVTRKPETGFLAAFDRVEIVAVTPEGCAPLEGPLAAFNWFSLADRGSYFQYANAIREILSRRGTRLLAGAEHLATLEAPTGFPSTGGAYVHDDLGLPLYASASEFLDMISSPEFQAIAPLQQAGARQDDYVFGFQRCIVGCDSGTPIHGTGDALLLMHAFRFEGADLDTALRSLADAPGAAEMAYGGRLVARLRFIVGGTNVNTQSLPWGEGLVLFRVGSEAEAGDWVDSASFRAFRNQTAEDVLVLLGPTSLPG